MTGHEFWDEQAAGYALDALDPDELAEFEAHLAGCAECRQLIDQHALVAAQLGALAYDDRPAPTWAEIRAGVVGSADSPATTVVPMRRRTRAVALTSAAAAVALVVGITVWQTSGGSSRGPLTSAASCARTPACHVVGLRAVDRSVPASVLVYGNDVALVTTTLGRPPTGSEWALWRLPKSGAPRLITTFNSASGTRTTINVPYADIAGFAVSREPAGTTPTSPSTVVASGTDA